MNIETKLSLLRTATSLPFTDKSSLFERVLGEFPDLSVGMVEEFFEGMVDFELVGRVRISGVEGVEDKECIEPGIDKVDSNNTPPSSLNSSLNSPAPVPIQSPSPPLFVPVKTPSGRTLRSNSTVNTSEPRRLRNSSIYNSK